jgi:hypothetical protein
MKAVFLTFILCLCIVPLYAQHLLVQNNAKRSVIKVHQESDVSVYYSEWPDTSKKELKAVLQKDIQSLTVIAESDIDSVYSVVSVEREMEKTKAAKREKIGAYFSGKASFGYNSDRYQVGMFIEGGIEVKHKYRIGLGCGGERVNQVVNGTQIPVYISVNRTLFNIKNKHEIYALGNAGYNFVLNENENQINSRLLLLGVGVCLKDLFIVEVYYKSQKAHETNQRIDVFGYAFGFLF